MRLLIVEDDDMIGSFIEKGFLQAGYAVDRVADAENALNLLGLGMYDLAVVDIMLPKMDGLTLIEEVRRKGDITPVLILSARQSIDDRVVGLQKGGDDYLTKPFSFAELLARVQALMRRSGMKKEILSEFRVHDLSLNILTREITRAGRRIELNMREFSLLEYMMRNEGMVLSKTMILERVWDYHFDPQTNVVDVLIHRLRNKIDRDFDKKLIHTVRGIGYVLRE